MLRVWRILCLSLAQKERPVSTTVELVRERILVFCSRVVQRHGVHVMVTMVQWSSSRRRLTAGWFLRHLGQLAVGIVGA